MRRPLALEIPREIREAAVPEQQAMVEQARHRVRPETLVIMTPEVMLILLVMQVLVEQQAAPRHLQRS